LICAFDIISYGCFLGGSHFQDGVEVGRVEGGMGKEELLASVQKCI